MISDTELFQIAFVCVVAAGAAGVCPNHPTRLLETQLDDDLLADRQGQAWDMLVARAKDAGFDGDPNGPVQSALIYTLQSVDEACPECGAVLDPPEDPEHRRKPHPWLDNGAA